MEHREARRLVRKALPNLLIVLAGVLLYAFFSHFGEISRAAGAALGLLAPFLAAFGIAYLLAKPLGWLERRWLCFVKSPRVRRIAAVGIVYLLFLGLIAALVALLIPQLVASIRSLIAQSGSLIDQGSAFLQRVLAEYGIGPDRIAGILQSWEGIWDKAIAFLQAALPRLLGWSMSVGGFLVKALLALVASVYLLYNKERFCSQCKRVLYALFSRRRVDGALRVGALAHRTFGGFLTGQIADSLLVGVLCFIGTSLLKIPYAPLVSVVVGCTNVIPVFGPFLGGVPSGIIILIADPVKCLWFVLFIVCLQQIDGNFICPRILGQSIGLSPFWVMLSIVVGGGLFGPLGMFLAVPTFSVLYTLFGEFVGRRLRRRGLAPAGEGVSPPPLEGRTE